MPINSVSQSTGTVVGGAERNYSEIDSIDFMNLLVAQIQNQDPLSPMDNAEFTSQITQFTQLDTMTKMQATMEENLLMSQSINNTAMLSLVGKDVTVVGDEVHVSADSVTGSKINCHAPGTATVKVTDSDGQLVDTYTVTVEAGLNDVSWDGLKNEDELHDAGEYTIEVDVKDLDNNPVDATVLMTGAVGGLRYDNGVPLVEVFGYEYYVADIYQVS